MWKKVLGVLVVIAAGVGLAAWGIGPKSLVTTDAGNVSQAEYYKKLKSSPEGQKELANMIIQKVLDKKYGDKVSKKSIESQYNDAKSQYGSQFSQVLSQNGMTEDSFRDSLRIQALEKQAVIADKHYSNKQLHKAYKEYQPKVSVSVMLTSSEDDAKKIIAQLDKGGDFAKLAKEKSIDTNTKKNGGKMTSFDSTDTNLEDDFKTAAFKLKKGEYTKTPVKSTSSQGYFIIKMNSKSDKKSFSALKSKMKSILVEKTMSDTTEVQAIVGEELGKANVNIKDSTLQNVLSTYTQAAATAKTAKSSSSSESSSSSSESSSSSSEASSSSSSSSSASSDSSSSSSSASSESSN
ncbi:peptidylprolyl isomerase [Weissella paramesenteroides]